MQNERSEFDSAIYGAPKTLIPWPVKIIFYLIFQSVLYWATFQLPWPIVQVEYWGGTTHGKEISKAVLALFWFQFLAMPLVPIRLKLFLLIEYVLLVALASVPAWPSPAIRLGWLVLPNFLGVLYAIQFLGIGLVVFLSRSKQSRTVRC